MAYPLEDDVETAIDNLLAVATENPDRRNARLFFNLVLKIASMVEQIEPTTYANFYSEGGWSQADFNT